MRLLEEFISHVHAAGLDHQLPPPDILVDHVPSFGSYSEDTNTLRTSDWALLDPEERDLFFRLTGPDATESAARAIFEESVHGWIFVHELGHWWQACQGGHGGQQPYEFEIGANRTALAFWRAADPGLAARMVTLFHRVVDNLPSPLPPGAAIEPYFNENYQMLGPSPDYPWFQARMIITLAGETPTPNFAEVLLGVGQA